jgi:hypothetical protein
LMSAGDRASDLALGADTRAEGSLEVFTDGSVL